MFFVLQKSKYDGQHHLAIAAVKKERVAEVMSFDPKTKSLSVLELTGDALSPMLLNQTLGFIPDATMQLEGNSFGEEVSKTMYSALMNYSTLHTDLTIFDVIRLYFFSKNVSEENKIVKKIALPRSESEIDKLITSFFGDETLSSEDVSIHVINASDVPGMGKRLERVLNNLGCNVISVSTANAPVEQSSIQYKGKKEIYTVSKLKRLLGFPVAMSTSESRANIVITVGKDSKNTKSF